MQSIITRYIGPTDHKGARIVAQASGGKRIVVSYDHSASCPHTAAAKLLAQSLHNGARGWDGRYAVGELPKGGRVFVPITDYDQMIALPVAG